MKLLERLTMLHWFLYERVDLDIARNTAFLGPNGTGKTALLDAIQTVMLGADQSRVRFNAQADGKKRDRNLQSYCLGVYDQRSDGRCRLAATTYISLVFRDEATGEPVTAGVALSARHDATEPTFHGLFILPGVALSSADLVEADNGAERILPWREAQAVFRNLVQAAGAGRQATVTQHREDFVKRLLLDHLAAPGDKPNSTMFRHAFQQSLHLKVMEDLSAALRDYLIEPQQTRIRDFKERADQFRKMRDLVARIRDQLAGLSRVRKEYDKVRLHRARETNYQALAAVLDVEAVGDREAEHDDEMRRTENLLKHAAAERERARAAAQVAKEAEDLARDARARDPAYQQQAASSNALHTHEAWAGEAKAAVDRELAKLYAGVGALSRLPDFDDEKAAVEHAAGAIAAVHDGVAAGRIPDVPSVAHLAQAVANVVGKAQRRSNQAERDVEAAKVAMDQARLNHERAMRGLGQLSANVQLLQLRLQEAGIEATPVCDLVEITEEAWQPVIEAYLGSNVQALLVSRADEKSALGLYRKLRTDENVYGAKLATPTRIRPWRATGAGKFAAALVQGDDADAVSYLQGELGRIACVETVDELLHAERAFTRDGMIAAGGGVDRRRLIHELRIGRQNREAARARAEIELRHAQDAHASASRLRKQMHETLALSSPFAAADLTRDTLLALFNDLQTRTTTLEDLRRQQAATMTGDLATLETRLLEASKAATAARAQHEHWLTTHAGLEGSLGRLASELERIRRESEEARARERHAKAQPLYDPNEVERLREKEETADAQLSVPARVAECRRKAESAGRAASAAETEAASQLTTYHVQFNVNADVPPDWVGRARMVEHEYVRLETLTLAEKEAEAENALKAAERVFRTDVVHSLLTGFDRIKEQIAALNLVLRKAPEFSNRERYSFKHHVVDQYRDLHSFIEKAREFGAEDSLWGEADRMPREFRELMESDLNSPLLADTSPLFDCRRFFAFDIDILRNGESIGVLSKRFGPGSGGEHRTPLYVIFGAALAAAYGNLHGRNAGGGLMLLDEAFDKMDAQNVRAVAEYLNALGLQLLMAGPETDQPKLSSFLFSYYDLARHGSRTIQMDYTIVEAAARELLASDNPLYHPELLEREIERLRDLGDAA